MYAGNMVKDPSGTASALAVTWDLHPWESDQDAPMSRRERAASRGPYRAALPARIARLEISLPAEAESEAADATAEITRFDADASHALRAGGNGGPAPLAAVLLRTESASSSQIEEVTAGAKALALATIDERTGPNARLVVGNVDAMRTAIDLSDEITIETMLAAHRALLHEQPRALPGRFRDQQVWIGGGGSSPHSATFVPPHHDHVQPAMNDLMDFCRRTDMPPLTQAAIAHAQFETIHPFVDGNGRVGRVLVHAMLRHARVTRRVTVPVSAGLLMDTRSYFDALGEYRRGDAAPIVSRFGQAAFHAVSNGRTLVADLERISSGWLQRVEARRDAAVWRLLPLLLRQPAINLNAVREATGVSQPAAHHAIDELVRARVITPASKNKRNRVWVAGEVVEALDQFAERARRAH